MRRPKRQQSDQKQMKASAQPIDDAQTMERSLSGVICDLIKLRLTALVLATTLVGFYLAAPKPLQLGLLLSAMLGTFLLASGVAALNQLLEAQFDSKMLRTESRPLPSGRLHPDVALIFGGACSAAGLILLALRVNLVTSLLGALTLASYLFVYTPLKRKTTLNTLIGAIPGALPPLMGWTAATGAIEIGGWSLFAILFFWQLPHFLAIAWLYRDDYARAGFVMLPVVDQEGKRTGRSSVSHTLGLLPISLFPFLLGISGRIYVVGALILGLFFLSRAIRFSRELTHENARRLFFASIIYLPLLLALMAFDKV